MIPIKNEGFDSSLYKNAVQPTTNNKIIVSDKNKIEHIKVNNLGQLSDKIALFNLYSCKITQKKFDDLPFLKKTSVAINKILEFEKMNQSPTLEMLATLKKQMKTHDRMMKHQPLWIRIASYFSRLFGLSTIGKADNLYTNYFNKLIPEDRINLKKMITFAPLKIEESQKMMDVVMGNVVQLTKVEEYYLMSGEGIYTGFMTKHGHKPHDRDGILKRPDGTVYKGKFDNGIFKNGIIKNLDGQVSEFKND